MEAVPAVASAATAVAGSSGLGWLDIGKIVLASGVVAALVGWLKDGIFRRNELMRDARFCAIGIIAKLDLYALQSRSNVRDYYEYTAALDPHRDYQNWPSCPYPEFVVTPEELKSLDHSSASALAWISTEKAIAGQHLHAIHEAAFDPTEAPGHKADIVGYFGYEAFLLAGRLREKFDLPSFGQRWGAADDFQDLQHFWTATKAEVSKRAYKTPVEE